MDFNLIAVAALFLSSLVNTSMETSIEATTEAVTETWWINSARKDCVGVAPMTCFEIQRTATMDPQGWELFYSQIKGFNYEPGFLYRVQVNIQERSPPIPADVSSKAYELLEVLSKSPDPALRLTNLWKVLSVGEFPTPTNARGRPLVFEFNASMRTYAGDLGCNRVHGPLFQNDGERLAFGPGVATKMVCPDMTLERLVSDALQATRRYSLRENVLRFFDEDGQELMTFQAGD